MATLVNYFIYFVKFRECALDVSIPGDMFCKINALRKFHYFIIKENGVRAIYTFVYWSKKSCFSFIWNLLYRILYKCGLMTYGF